MTLPASGSISLSQVNTELGYSSTAQIGLGDAAVRTLAGVASGAISMSNLYGKSNRPSITYTFSSSTANASLNLSSLSGYSAGTSDITVVINPGVYLYATSTGNYGLNITGGTTGDTLTIVNYGYIMGQGGEGGWGYRLRTGQPTVYTDPTPGGPALNLGFGISSCTINNTYGSAYIGGGGGAGAAGNEGDLFKGGGGGAGGGAGGRSTYQRDIQVAGGAGGGIGSVGGNGVVGYFALNTYASSGAGGGRIFSGTGGAGGTKTSDSIGGGAGGGGGGRDKAGGNGGAANNPGGIGGYTSSNDNEGGGGGGWGAIGGYCGGSYRAGSAGGKAINTNGKSITWTSGDTSRIYGSVS